MRDQGNNQTYLLLYKVNKMKLPKEYFKTFYKSKEKYRRYL